MRFSRSAVRAIFQNVFVMGLLPAALLAGCGAPPPESSPGVQVSEGRAWSDLAQLRERTAEGGVPGSVPPGEGENPVEPAGDGEDAPADFPEDGGTGSSCRASWMPMRRNPTFPRTHRTPCPRRKMQRMKAPAVR